MKKIISIIGARPQFIKAATVSRHFLSIKGVEEKIIHTGQHYDNNMSKIFFQELGIPKPTFNLGIGSLSHGAQTGKMLTGIETILIDERPDFVIVYGDTNSTLAGALASAKLHIPVAHVEAGLRSFNRHMPEEINRILTDHISDILFIQTQAAKENLLHEGITETKIVMTGDVMFDAAIYFGEIAEQKSTLLKKLGLQSKEFILATVHRAENTDSRDTLIQIFEALIAVVQKHTLVLPLHPRTKKALEENGIWSTVSKQLLLIEPVGFFDMIMLEKNAFLIITDSGGIQKEAFFHKTPCLTLRNETEWTELVEFGFNILVGANKQKIIDAIKKLQETFFEWDIPLYGDGSASNIIAGNIFNQIK